MFRYLSRIENLALWQHDSSKHVTGFWLQLRFFLRPANFKPIKRAQRGTQIHKSLMFLPAAEVPDCLQEAAVYNRVGSLVSAVFTEAVRALVRNAAFSLVLCPVAVQIHPARPNRSEWVRAKSFPLCLKRLEPRWLVVLPDQLPAAHQQREQSAALSSQGQLNWSLFELLHIVIARCDIKDSLT